ncbi:MAG TPA: NAD(P)(+) transhydrogenase (Re/Si-specific) subunit beta [Acidimicrobiia bacterium]|nr:NAD(P)(+) transhydrogenase (Re/Si-specific) subunit beta [Acidimicrobiia bacterium]
MITLFYLLSGALFIIGLRGLGSPRTARRGNQIAGAGMALASVVTLVYVFDHAGDNDLGVLWWVIVVGAIIGGAIGAVLALKVKMTAMPELVAAFNGFGGGASALVAFAEIVAVGTVVATNAPFATETEVTVALSIAIGVVTFSGSFVAYAKLQGLITGKPVALPGGPFFNLALVLLMTGASIWAVGFNEPLGYWILAAIALVLGVTGVIPIGGADMPVVISLLNSLSGVAAAMAGFVIGNQGLIIAGALVGAAGFILTVQMSEAMNRSLANVLFAGFGTEGAAPIDAGDKPVNSATPEDVAIALAYAQKVIVVPGYGLAVAQAQHAVRDLATALEEREITVEYAIHPVAGRMPGHMNVLLAEADVPYDVLLDLDHSNPRFPHTDVVLVVGANDVVNPSARDDSTSPIYGMPILEVDLAATTVVIKRSLAPGFAGIDNPLFYMPSTMMLFSDAKAALEHIEEALADL